MVIIIPKKNKLFGTEHQSVLITYDQSVHAAAAVQGQPKLFYFIFLTPGVNHPKEEFAVC